jgi:hypothetical protein
MSDNPFEALGLDPTATEEEVVRRAGQLRQRLADEAALDEVRQAVQALTGRPEERRLLALLTPPGPCYDWPATTRLMNAHRRAPAGAAEAPAPPPELNLAEFADLLRPLLIEELATGPVPFELGGCAETPEEVFRQTVEALWQNLPAESGA